MLTKTEDLVSAAWHLWQVMSVTTNCYAWHVTPGDDRSHAFLWLVTALPLRPLIGRCECGNISLGIRCHQTGPWEGGTDNWEGWAWDLLLRSESVQSLDNVLGPHPSHPPGLTLVTNQVTRWRINTSRLGTIHKYKLFWENRLYQFVWDL